MPSIRLLPVQDRARLTKAEPVVKWAGGKTRLLPELTARLPEDLGRYYEPFLGGAAMFLSLQPAGAVLTDINEELVHLYRTIQSDVEALIDDLDRHRYEAGYYYAMRAQNPRRLAPIARASRTLYLNKTCFNGLYRVNRRGEFNVPMGRYKNPTIGDPERLRALSEVLQGCEVVATDYATATATAQRGDFVYFDPPYFPLTRTSSFTSYTKEAFAADDQRRLAETFDDLTARGVRCMQSNSDTPFIRELYRHHRVEAINAPRAIARDPERRKSVSELIIMNY
ncbi:MAG: DNA adenine methylase [Myxococcales bacterium]|nr:DNA adenine methylase [Myxococcales bacterium]MCB9731562.1 DNA adenine methylase [Deltaproteobacteria bacterium]